MVKKESALLLKKERPYLKASNEFLLTGLFHIKGLNKYFLTTSKIFLIFRTKKMFALSGGITMNIYVLLKRTFDTEEKITISNGKINEDGAEFIINPYDEYAVEEAIQVRDAHGGEVTVVTVGNEEAEKQLRTALAMGADKAVLINIEDDVENGDQFTTAKILAEYLKDKDADFILAGNVAIDGGSGQVGPRVAELLGYSLCYNDY